MSEADREALTWWIQSMKAGLVDRTRIVLLIRAGVRHLELTRRSGVSRQTVLNWPTLFEKSGVAARCGDANSGRAQTRVLGAIITATLTPAPLRRGVMYWSS